MLEHRKAPKALPGEPGWEKLHTLVCQYIPESVETLVRVIRHDKAPRALRVHCAEALIDYEIKLLGVGNQAAQAGSPADRMAQVTADERRREIAERARQQFQQVLDNADALPVLDDFKAPVLAPSQPGIKDQTSLMPEPSTIDLDSIFESNVSSVVTPVADSPHADATVTPLPDDAQADARAEVGGGPSGGGGDV